VKTLGSIHVKSANITASTENIALKPDHFMKLDPMLDPFQQENKWIDAALKLLK